MIVDVSEFQVLFLATSHYYTNPSQQNLTGVATEVWWVEANQITCSSWYHTIVPTIFHQSLWPDHWLHLQHHCSDTVVTQFLRPNLKY